MAEKKVEFLEVKNRFGQKIFVTPKRKAEMQKADELFVDKK